METPAELLDRFLTQGIADGRSPFDVPFHAWDEPPGAALGLMARLLIGPDPGGPVAGFVQYATAVVDRIEKERLKEGVDVNRLSAQCHDKDHRLAILEAEVATIGQLRLEDLARFERDTGKFAAGLSTAQMDAFELGGMIRVLALGQEADLDSLMNESQKAAWARFQISKAFDEIESE